MHRRAAEHFPLLVEQEAVDRLGLQQPGHLVHQPLEHRVELELAGHRLGGLQQRRLLAEPAFVLVQQPRRVQRQAELAGDGLGQAHVARRPRPRLAPMQREHADHAVEDDHRRGEHGARAEPRQALDAAQGRIAEPGRVEHVGDRNSAPLAPGEVRDRQARHGFADRLEPVRPPLGADRHRLAALAEPDEAARGVDRAARLGHGDARDRVQVVNRADAARDLRHQPLARECPVERGGRARAVERDRGLAGERLHQPDLLRGEGSPLAGGRGDQHADHALLDDQRHEDGALRVGGSRQPLADERRRFDVVDRHRRRLEERARDPGGLVVQMHAHLAPPREVLAG